METQNVLDLLFFLLGEFDQPFLGFINLASQIVQIIDL
jgi:hypothetical protein